MSSDNDKQIKESKEVSEKLNEKKSDFDYKNPSDVIDAILFLRCKK
jgi:hypothetical protein